MAGFDGSFLTAALHDFDVEVFLNDGPDHFARFDPASAVLRRAATFAVQAVSATAARDIAYAIANSYPGELHCSPLYAGQVAAYRAACHRSLSVGDAVVVRTVDGPVAYACETNGWTRPPAAVVLGRVPGGQRRHPARRRTRQ